MKWTCRSSKHIQLLYRKKCFGFRRRLFSFCPVAPFHKAMTDHMVAFLPSASTECFVEWRVTERRGGASRLTLGFTKVLDVSKVIERNYLLIQAEITLPLNGRAGQNACPVYRDWRRHSQVLIEGFLPEQLTMLFSGALVEKRVLRTIIMELYNVYDVSHGNEQRQFPRRHHRATDFWCVQ